MGVRADYSMITLFSFTLAFTLFKLFNKVMACSNVHGVWQGSAGGCSCLKGG